MDSIWLGMPGRQVEMGPEIQLKTPDWKEVFI